MAKPLGFSLVEPQITHLEDLNLPIKEEVKEKKKKRKNKGENKEKERGEKKKEEEKNLS